MDDLPLHQSLRHKVQRGHERGWVLGSHLVLVRRLTSEIAGNPYQYIDRPHESGTNTCQVDRSEIVSTFSNHITLVLENRRTIKSYVKAFVQSANFPASDLGITHIPLEESGIARPLQVHPSDLNLSGRCHGNEWSSSRS
jgi:hypothetical protein